jgi:hypothetical protein
MNCQDFEKLAPALARNSLLDNTTREQGSIHTEGCARCAARLAEERALLIGMRAVVADLAGEEPPERVETALLAAFRAQNATIAPRAVIPAPTSAWHWLNWKLAAVAAGILIFISLMIWRSAGSFKSEKEKQANSPTPAGAPQSEPSKQAVQPVFAERIVVEKKTQKPLRRRASVESSEDEEVVTRFFPLREGEDITALESLQFVRVELPGSALGEFGLPVDPETANAPVLADVVLGQDGLARAIRFVR